MVKNVLLLDSVANITVNQHISPVKNFRNLFDLKEGLIMTATSLKRLELETPDDQGGRGMSIDFSPNPKSSLVVNLFNWFSVNLLSFANCCALLEFVQKEQKLPDEYAGNKELLTRLKRHRASYLSSIPELKPVKFYRDKIGAHLAFSDPRMDDNIATLLESLSLSIGCVNGRYQTGIFERGRGEHKSEFANHHFSVTRTFERLKERYLWDYSDINV